MFGSNGFSQQSNDDPAMLDNVKQLAQDPADTSAAIPTPVNPPSTASPFTPTTVSAAPQDPVQQTTSVTDDSHRAEPAEGFSSTPVADPVSPTPTFITATDTQNDQTVAGPATSAPPSIQSTSAPVQEDTQKEDTVPEAPTTTEAPVAQPQPDQNHLAGLKQQALEHLGPLSDHIDGTPEETFKTTMMMIQANDNHTLLEKALEAAKKIEDDKVRAKAMLDVINEINYFSQINSNE